ncbi:MAG: hypothetical protein WCC84_10070 [Candidatus Cybelea sp.]
MNKGFSISIAALVLSGCSAHVPVAPLPSSQARATNVPARSAPAHVT